MTFKKIEVGHWTPPLGYLETPTMYKAYGKRKKNLNLISAVVKMYSNFNLKGSCKTFNGKFEGFYVPRNSQM